MKKLKLKILLITAFTLFVGIISAQTGTVRGTVTDSQGQPLIGATVVIKGTQTHALTGDDGSYTISAPGNVILVFSYVGYTQQEIQVSNRTTINVEFEENVLDDFVVIGYGSVRKQDMTGSVASVSDKDFTKGGASPDRLIVGKVAGVQVSPNGGAPGSGSRIRIRGGASLNAKNDPLIVIDGLPLENGGVAGSPSLLSTINPNDIESMTILKDASATAIYGSRASNGVIMITTKQAKQGQKLKIGFSMQHSVATYAKKLEVFSADEFRNEIMNNPYSGPSFQAMLTSESTDWQKQIYQSAFGTDYNLNVSGDIKNIPFRVSVGYFNEDGILKTGNMERISAGLNLNPRFFNNHLKVDVSVKGSLIDNRFANTDAIKAALAFDPTKPVRADGFDKYHGYYTWLLSNGDLNSLAYSNPLMMLNEKNNSSDVKRIIVSGQIDYRMHFLPDLRANLNLAYDYSEGRGEESYPDWVPFGVSRKGKYQEYGNDKTNKLFEFYLNYNKNFSAIKSQLDLTAGHTYQDWLTHSINYIDYTAMGDIYADIDFPFDEPRNTLMSFFGRLNYTFNNRYLVTASLRYDGSSRFSEDNRWGLFPSAAFAWRIDQESFLKNVKPISNLKLRLGYGVTGQQEIGNDRYAYLARYKLSTDKYQYQLGDTFYKMYRPAGYDSDIKWESTTTYNAGLDFGLLKDRITGSFDVYLKKTKDLLTDADIPAGTNFANRLKTNVGNMENRGVEFTINADIVRSKDWNWDASFNIGYNKNKITRLSIIDDPNHAGFVAGWLDGTTNGTSQLQKVGYPTYTFYLYQQVYGPDGKPLEGVYVDRNNDGTINTEDRLLSHSANPSTLMGFTTNINYRNWTLSTVMRASFGNYVFNNVSSSMAHYSGMFNTASMSLVNIPKNVDKTGFLYKQSYSDFYLENASFLKMDNISLTYDFKNLFPFGLTATASVQNVFTITKYTGLDPEISDGVDRDFYPRPRTFLMRLNFSF